MLRSIARRLCRRLEREDGFALVLALGTLVVLSVAGASVAAFSNSNYRASVGSHEEVSALSLAEAGLNMAFSRLQAAPSPTVSTAVPATWAPDVPTGGGFASYRGSYDAATKVWTLFGRGRVARASAPGSFTVRVVYSRAVVSTGLVGGAANGAWNYLYSDDPNSCATMSNNTTIDVSVYVRGGLCLNQSATIRGGQVEVGGRVTVNGQQAGIGTAAAPAQDVRVVGGCSVDGVTYFTPCGPAQNVYTLSTETTLTPLSKPPIDLPYWYANAQPGPLHGCTVGSFPGGFDNDRTLNRSLPKAVDLTPKTPYDCRVLDGNGNVVGQISWTPGAPGRLTIAGTLFFDGDIVMSQLVNAQYAGRATIYASGTISLQNQVTLCPVTGCNDAWDPNVNLLAFVAGSSTDATGFNIGQNSMFQGAVYAVNDFSAGNNTTMWGPVIARQIYLSNSTMNVFPPINSLLSGMPSSYNQVTTVALDAGSWGQ